MVKRRISLAAIGILATASCQHAAVPQPARLADTSATTRTALKAHLADAIGRANIELGAGELAQSSTITVLPPPLSPNETSSPVVPIVFDLVLRGDSCFAVRRDTQVETELSGVSCRPA